MAISCVYCGGSHEQPGEVRACWARLNGAEAPPAARRDPPVHESAAAAVRSVSPVVRARPVSAGHHLAPASRLAGPVALGRGLVVHDDAAPPPPWRDAPRLVVDASTLDTPDDAIEQLRAAQLARQRVVVELRVQFTDTPAATDTRPLHRIGPLGRLPLEELHHLVWSNSVVLDGDGSGHRGDGDAWFAPLDAAIAVGARPAGAEAGDAALPDGTPVWVDGGPLRWSAPIDGVRVVPYVSVEHGSARPFGPNDSTAALAPDQLAAVTHGTAACRIIAPAGSGKTRVLTERARHLVREWGLPPAALSLVAYNRRAQAEMQQRLADVPGVQVRTLNAIALAILNGAPPFAPRAERVTTIDESQVRRVLGDLVQAPRRRAVDPLAPWLAAMSTTRLGLRAPEDVEALYDGDVSGLAQVLPQYEAELRRAGTVDFDGQIVEAIRLLLTDPEVRRAAQRANRVLLVDEFQDLTPAHVLLLRLLSAPAGQVFGVGDDDQTIYGYNGADPRWLLDYTTLFPGAGEHQLEVNYRCPADVVEQADRLLRRNLRRVPKAIRADRAGTRGVEVRAADDAVAATATAVREALASGASAADVAVLARVNAALVPVQIVLAGAGVPVVKVEGERFLDRGAIRSALAWLRLATGPADALAGGDLAEAVRRPSRSISPRLAGWVAEQRSVAGIERLAGRLESERDAERVRELAGDLAMFRRAADHSSTARMVDLLCDEIGLAGTLATLDVNRRGMNAPSQGDDLLALRQLAQLHEDPATFPGWLAAQLRLPGHDDGVTLATVHRVKGQEWPHVVVHLADREQFPHRLADDVTEERRLFHVAITRTSGRVTIVHGRQPSPFVAELHTEPTAEELRLPAPASRPGIATRAARTGVPSGGRAGDGAERGPLTSGRVVAGPGVVLVDQGQEWVVTGVISAAADDAPGDRDRGAAVAARGDASRRFAFGSKVSTAGRQRGPLAAPPADLAPASPAAFDALRQLRERLRGSKPAYTVFDDATLERIAVALPPSLADLARVKGVGPAKLEQYGDQVLAVVATVVDAVG